MDLLTVSEAARYLRMNAEVLRRKTKAGEVPGCRMGGRWKYSKETLDKWIRCGCPACDEKPSPFPQGR